MGGLNKSTASGALIAAGAVAVIVSFNMDTAPAGTHNLGLLQTQLMVLHTGLGAAIMGAILSLRAETSTEQIPRTRPIATASPEAAEPMNHRPLIALGLLVAALLAFALIIGEIGQQAAQVDVEAIDDANALDANMSMDANLATPIDPTAIDGTDSGDANMSVDMQ